MAKNKRTRLLPSQKSFWGLALGAIILSLFLLSELKKAFE
jgi:hypothetical protein